MVVRELLAKMGIQIDQKSISDADRAIGRVKGALMGLAGAYGLKKIYDFVQAKFDNIANTATDLTTLAQKTGMSTQALQELQYAAAQTNVDAGELRMGLVHLERSAFEAATTGGAAGAAFKRLGIEVTGADGKLRPTNELLGMVADKFLAMKDGPEKAALSLALLSHSGSALIPVMNGGSAGLAKWGAEARKTGGLLSEGLIKQGVELHHTIVRLQYVVMGLTNAVFGPFIRSVIASKNSLAAWIATNRQLIALRVQEVVSVIAGAFQLLAKAVQEFGFIILPLGALILGLVTPFQLLLAAIVFFANDLNRYLGGKDSVIGRLLFALSKLGDSIKADGIFSFLIDGLKFTLSTLDDLLVEWAKGAPGRMLMRMTDVLFDAGDKMPGAGPSTPGSFDSSFGPMPKTMMWSLLGIPPSPTAAPSGGRGQIIIGDITIHAHDQAGGAAAADEFTKRIDAYLQNWVDAASPGR